MEFNRTRERRLPLVRLNSFYLLAYSKTSAIDGVCEEYLEKWKKIFLACIKNCRLIRGLDFQIIYKNLLKAGNHPTSKEVKGAYYIFGTI